MRRKKLVLSVTNLTWWATDWLPGWLADWLPGSRRSYLPGERLCHRQMSRTAAESSERWYVVLTHPPRQSEAEGLRAGGGGGREAALLRGWGRSSAALPTSTRGGWDLFVLSSAQAPCSSVRPPHLHFTLVSVWISHSHWFLQVTIIRYLN